MTNRSDIAGQIFGKLKAIAPTSERKRGYVVWQFKCGCGNVVHFALSRVTHGRTKSCGCEKPGNVKHGMSRTPIYRAWISMMSRCTDPKHESYRYYGGRGISFHHSWNSFEQFYNDMGDLPFPEAQIDRKENDKDYGPTNCHWVTAVVNQSNKSNNRYLSYDGESKTIAEWSRVYGIAHSVISYRIRAGWTIDDAITLPCALGNRWRNKQ